METLQGAGPFTVFAPTNAAFDGLPKGTVDTLVKPENKAMLTKILTYHVVPREDHRRRPDGEDQGGQRQGSAEDGRGENLTATMDGSSVVIMDERGTHAKVTTADVMQSNGVIHVVDKVLHPK